jgi:hypothetical protein
MNEKRVHVSYEQDEPHLLIIDDEEYQWNGQFDVPVNIVNSLSLEDLPINIKIKPYKQIERGVIIHPIDGDFSLIRTREGLVAVVENQQYSKYWSHPIISLPCYMNNLKEEIEAGKEFKILYFDNDGDINYNYSFQTKLVGIEKTAEALKLAKNAIKALERRVRNRILVKVKEWAESV